MSGPPSSSTAAEILAWCDESPTLLRTVQAVRALGELDRREPGTFRPLRLAVVRNHPVEPGEPMLRLACYRRGIALSAHYSGYAPSPGPELEALCADADAVLVALRLEELAPSLASEVVTSTAEQVAALSSAVVSSVLNLVDAASDASKAAVLIQNFPPPAALRGGALDAQLPFGEAAAIRRINLGILDALGGHPGAYVVDVERALEVVGLTAAYGARPTSHSESSFSPAGLRALGEVTARVIAALSGPRVKCLVVDCDDTLWGGVLGEVGVEGIALGPVGVGRRHQDLQRWLRDLRTRGTLLAISSRNEEADVLSALQLHPEMVLRESDFVATRIGWGDKADGIASIADELNLGLQHVAFIDDDPHQCALVHAALPDVTVLAWPGDFDGMRSLHDTELFDTLSTTDEDYVRTELYRAESGRTAARARAISLEDHLRSLSLEVTIGTAESVHLPRLAQLMARTNQFNLTTRRYGTAELLGFAEDPRCALLWVALRDRFGDYGTVGCALVRASSGTAEVDAFLLSCRVLGRDVESALAARAAECARLMGADRLEATFEPTERNGQVATLWSRLGFVGPEVRNGIQTWTWDLARGLPEVPDWLTVRNADRGEAGST